jgi:hypothetical protein
MLYKNIRHYLQVILFFPALLCGQQAFTGYQLTLMFNLERVRESLTSITDYSCNTVNMSLLQQDYQEDNIDLGKKARPFSI